MTRNNERKQQRKKFHKELNDSFSYTECKMLLKDVNLKRLSFNSKRMMEYFIKNERYGDALKLTKPDEYQDQFNEYYEINKKYEY